MAGGPKVRGANFMFKKLTNIRPKDLIKNHKIYAGDLVQVVKGKRDVGKNGIVLSVIKNRNLIVVKDVAMAVKHMKPNPFYPKGDKILKETPIQYSNVQLVDPSLNKPVKVSMKTMHDPALGRDVLVRISKESKVPIPLPPKKDLFKDQAEGPLDTKPDLVSQITWSPSIFKCPFPNSLMNELERWERRGNAAKAL